MKVKILLYVIRYGQGDAFGLYVTINTKGYSKTKCTPKNIEAFKKAIEDFAKSKSSQRVDNGTYWVNHKNGFPTIILGNDEIRLVAIVKENREEYFELLSYQVRMEEHIF